MAVARGLRPVWNKTNRQGLTPQTPLLAGAQDRVTDETLVKTGRNKSPANGKSEIIISHREDIRWN
jgi:hypothetical protein